jgi:Fe-S-cluster containining protein
MTQEPGSGDGALVRGPDAGIHCDNCAACCCRLEVLLLTDTGVPRYLIATDAWGASVMARREDGWCAALERQTLRCSIYDRRPWICRELEMGGGDCVAARQAFAEEQVL